MNTAALHRTEPQAIDHARSPSGAVDGVRRPADEELDHRIRVGWDEWCELLERLLGTGGMLPPRELAAQAVTFFEDAYWRAEEARVEAFRRRLSAEGLRRRDELDRAWEIG
jgi:hypothetical protein